MISKPDRSDYELWIIDWLDGRLDESAVSLLKEFLDSNPDLREEADSLYQPSLRPDEISFRSKSALKKSASELPLSQIELLSVAFLENDITPGQLSDLEQSLETSIVNKKAFETIQKTRLVAPAVVFKNKNHLKKRETGAVIIRIPVAILSAAAAIALIVVSYFLIRNNSVSRQPAKEVIVSSVYKGEPQEIKATAYREPPVEKTIKKTMTNEKVAGNITLIASADTSTHYNKTAETPEIGHVPYSLIPEINPVLQHQLIASANIPYVVREESGPDRSRLSRFMARTFREKILKDPVLNDAPITTYEIAEAGVDGLGRLMGWDMSLKETRDSVGDLKSFYFSSRMLTFNVPVKKEEPLR